MPDNNQLDRLAAALNALRPDWPTRSLRTYLAREHADRAYVDLAIAAVFVAVDPRTVTPKRLSEHGPWWVAAASAGQQGTPTAGPGAEPRCEKDGHEYEAARNCRWCRSELIAKEDA
jgi:hypothetical protein